VASGFGRFHPRLAPGAAGRDHRRIFPKSYAIRPNFREKPVPSCCLRSLAKSRAIRLGLLFVDHLVDQADWGLQIVLGPEHPDTAEGLNNLARVLADQGDLAAAQVVRCLTISKARPAPGSNVPSASRPSNLHHIPAPISSKVGDRTSTVVRTAATLAFIENQQPG
jgi:hypothetical protein